MKNRLDYIDILKGIGILTVPLSHLFLPGNLLKIVLFSFHMPLFFLVVGLTYNVQPYRSLIVKRYKTILIPYMLWALIFSSFNIKNLCYILYGTNESLIMAQSNGMLWFLSAMFVSILIAAPFINKFSDGKVKLTLISFVLLTFSACLKHYHSCVSYHCSVLGYPLAIDIALLGAAFILIGYILPSVNNIPRRKLLLYSGGGNSFFVEHL